MAGGGREWWCVMSERLGKGKVVSVGGERAVAYGSWRKEKMSREKGKK